MRKQCAVCSEPFEAKRQTAKYCSRRCSVRASRQPKPQAAGELPPDPDFALEQATLAELTAAGRAGSAAGVAALILAQRIDRSRISAETGAGLAAMVKQHGATLAEALKGAKAKASPLDELRARREHKRAAG